MLEHFVEYREQLSERGHRDRKTGTFGVPEEDMAEPARTERLLASPFGFRRAKAADSFHAIEGFLLFRVHRLSLVILNVQGEVIDPRH